jgi:hypothetical protein
MRITSKGQVTIPVEIREKAGLLPDKIWSIVSFTSARAPNWMRARKPPVSETSCGTKSGAQMALVAFESPVLNA